MRLNSDKRDGSTYKTFSNERNIKISYGNKSLILRYKDITGKNGLPRCAEYNAFLGLGLTHAGIELYNAISPRFDQIFLDNLLEKVNLLDFDIKHIS
ncbi:MAG: hypothetical protein K0S29_1153 [Gammaproteobacteria bacterium]|jgi:hypothetical protein|nr:hypothetical protein [Gammaproteobacteria bacterium]